MDQEICDIRTMLISKLSLRKDLLSFHQKTCVVLYEHGYAACGLVAGPEHLKSQRPGRAQVQAAIAVNESRARDS